MSTRRTAASSPSRRAKQKHVARIALRSDGKSLVRFGVHDGLADGVVVRHEQRTARRGKHGGVPVGAAGRAVARQAEERESRDLFRHSAARCLHETRRHALLFLEAAVGEPDRAVRDQGTEGFERARRFGARRRRRTPASAEQRPWRAAFAAKLRMLRASAAGRPRVSQATAAIRGASSGTDASRSALTNSARVTSSPRPRSSSAAAVSAGDASGRQPSSRASSSTAAWLTSCAEPAAAAYATNLLPARKMRDSAAATSGRGPPPAGCIRRRSRCLRNTALRSPIARDQ